MAEKNKQTNQKLSCSRYDFPLHDIYFSSIIWQFKWLSLSRKIVEIQKFCVHVNVMSHLYCLFHDAGIAILQIQLQIALLVEVNNVQCFYEWMTLLVKKIGQQSVKSYTRMFSRSIKILKWLFIYTSLTIIQLTCDKGRTVR